MWAQVSVKQCLKEAILVWSTPQLSGGYKTFPPAPMLIHSNSCCCKLRSQCIPDAGVGTEKSWKEMSNPCVQYLLLSLTEVSCCRAVPCSGRAGELLCACSASSGVTELVQLPDEVPSALLIQRMYFFQFVKKTHPPALPTNPKKTLYF